MKSLTFKRNILPRAASIDYRLEKRVIWTLAIFAIIIAISYGYFVKQAIVNVVLREEIGQNISDIEASVSSLEVKYIDLKNKINLDYAYSLGYREAEGIKFVSRNMLGKTLTINHN